MSLDNQVGQEFPVKILKAHLEKERLAHTYLFTSGNDAAKKDLVTNFSISVLAQGNETSIESIEKKVRERNHPDMNWMGEDDTVRILKMEQVRELISWSTLKPFESDWKVAILVGAERLNIQSQNALLKTLEEPPSKTIYCLLVENRSNLLDTIRSRSFELRLQPVDGMKECEEDVMLPEGFGQKRWEDFFEDQQGLAKPDLFNALDLLMQYFHYLLKTYPQSAHSQAWLDVIDAIYETKDALNSNVNQKLAMTRLAICLKKILPHPKMLMLGNV